MLERLALARLFPHVSISPSFCPLQSAYRKFHSTETALLKLTNDIMETIDSGKITIQTALDMSAAFDTLDHTTLLHRLQHTFGLSGYVISWIRSYLTNRTSFVKIDSSSSPNTTICTGVPQGFCPWPTPLRSLHITCRQCHKSWPVRYQQHCILSSVRWWHSAVYRYKHVYARTSSRFDRILHSEGSQLGSWTMVSTSIHPSLRPLLFSTQGLSLSNPWLNPLHPFQLPVHPSSFNHQSRIWVFIWTLKCLLISKFLRHARRLTFTFVHCVTFDLPLPLRLARRITAAIVGSRLDYCNSLLAGTSLSNLARLQLVQNTLARVVTEKSRFCRITPVLFWSALASCSPQNRF